MHTLIYRRYIPPYIFPMFSFAQNPSTQSTDQVREHESCYTDMLLDEMWKKIFSYLSVREVIRLERGKIIIGR